MKRLIDFVKSHPALYRALRYGLYERLRSANRKRVFLNIYERRLWDDVSSLSGPGSSLDATAGLRTSLPETLAALGARSLLDVPCGDFHWMKDVPLGVDRYLGADIVRPLVEKNRREFGDRGEFLHLDLLKDPLPAADVVFCRDCLVHLSFREIRLALRNVRRAGPKYLMTTTFPHHRENADTVTPYWRALNLQAGPFDFPEPMYLIRDYSDSQPNDQGKHLGVWRMTDLEGLV